MSRTIAMPASVSSRAKMIAALAKWDAFPPSYRQLVPISAATMAAVAIPALLGPVDGIFRTASAFAKLM